MGRWARLRLAVMGAACIAGGVTVPFLSTRAGQDVLAAGLIVGGLAMLLVAVVSDRKGS